MSQISPPIRIIIVAAIGLLAAWMLFLRPKPEVFAEPTPAPSGQTAPGVKGLTTAVEKAEGAAKTQEESDAKVQKATGGTGAAGTAADPATATKPATKAAPSPADAIRAIAKDSSLPRPVVKAVDKEKVLVLLFWNKRSADDRATKQALRDVDRWNGRVFVRAEPLGAVSKYATITRDADVKQSPTVIVVDRKLKATTLVGYFDTQTIDQAVVDAIRNSGRTLKATYLRNVNEVCLAAGSELFAISQPNGLGTEVKTWAAGLKRSFHRFHTRFAAVTAGPKWRALRRATLADVAAADAALAGFAGAVGNGKSGVKVNNAIATYDPKLGKAGKSFNRRMDKHHVLACGSNGF